MPVGRSVDETIRLIQAFQFVEEHGEVCYFGHFKWFLIYLKIF